jgi:hypothetical protein
VVDQLSVDQRHGEVVRVDIATGAKTVIAQLTPGLDNLAFDSHDRLFVSSFQDGFIAEIEPDGEVRMISRGGMILPGGVAVLPRGRDNEPVVVADLFTLREFDARTGRQRSIERGLPGSSELISPVFTVAPRWRQPAADIVVPQPGAALGPGGARPGGGPYLRRAAERDPLPG